MKNRQRFSRSKFSFEAISTESDIEWIETQAAAAKEALYVLSGDITRFLELAQVDIHI